MAKKKIIWLSYDLGLRGDYPELYAVLDKHKAKDCGPNLAVFEVENSKKNKEQSVDDLINNLKSEIELQVKIKDSDRIYAIWKDDKTGKVKGKFIFGNRKRASWEGYYSDENIKTIEDSE